MKGKLFRILVLMLVCILVLGACQKTESKKESMTDEPEKANEQNEVVKEETEKKTSTKKDLIVAVGSDPRSLDPFGSNDSTSSTLKDQMYDALFEQTPDNNIVPSLVDEYEFTDDKTLEFTLKKGVKFHNGEELTPEDVLFSIEKGKDSEYTNWIVSNIDLEKSTIKDGKITLKLNESRGDQLASLCFLYIVDEQTVSKEGYDPEKEPIGTGPFKFEKHVKGDRIEFSGYKDYFEGAPAIEKLVFRIITEAASRTIELESGGVDVIYNVLASDISMLEESGSVTVHRTPNFSNQYIGFNCEKEPLNDPKVRQAISYCIDKEALVEAIYGDVGEVATGPIPKVVWGYTDEVMAYTQDYNKAKELLAEAGYPDGLEITITVSDSQQKIDTAEIFQNQLKGAGITVKPIVLENATFLDKVVEGDFEIFSLGWTTNTGDADYGLYETFHSGTPTWANTTRYSNSEVDELLEKARVNMNADERKEQYKKVQQIIVEEAPEIFLLDNEEVIAASSEVKGIVLAPSGRHNFKNVYFE